MTSSKTLEVVKQLENEIDLPQNALEQIGWVLRIMQRLRAPDGCPWDRVQTHESLLKNLIEESYEFIDTVRKDDDVEMREELGDLFMQVVFQAQVAEERGAFHIGEVAQVLAEKLVRRHPHVFGDKSADNQDEALTRWNDAKKKEGQHKFKMQSVPKSMPALLRSRKLTEKAARVGFEWAEISGAMEKVDEELAEFKEAVQSGDMEHIAEELGDLLFVIVNVARYVKICPEVALTSANDKFVRRFSYIEQKLNEQGRYLDEATLEEMDEIWDEAKAQEREHAKEVE